MISTPRPATKPATKGYSRERTPHGPGGAPRTLWGCVRAEFRRATWHLIYVRGHVLGGGRLPSEFLPCDVYATTCMEASWAHLSRSARMHETMSHQQSHTGYPVLESCSLDPYAVLGEKLSPLYRWTACGELAVRSRLAWTIPRAGLTCEEYRGNPGC